MLGCFQHVTMWRTRSFRRQGSLGMTNTLLLLPIFFSLIGCRQKEEQQPEVTVYTALDQEFSQSIFAAFTENPG